MEVMMKIGISGASGKLGAATVAELKSRAQGAQLWSASGFNVTTGEVERLAGRPPRSLEDALRHTKL